MSWKQEIGKKKSDPSARAQKTRAKLSLLVTNCFEWNWDLERLWFNLIVSFIECTSSCIEYVGWKLGCLEVWWLGGIYSPNHKNGRWRRMLSMGALDTVRCASHITQPLGFDRWSSDKWGHLTVRWCTGQSLFTVWCAFCACSDSTRVVRALFTHCSLLWRPLALLAVAPLGTPDSPVLHRTVWWIIAEWLPKFLKLASWSWSTLVHQTMAAFGWFCSFLFEPFLGLFIGLCWTFGTYRTYNLEQTS
jgi:hypothetical protein